MANRYVCDVLKEMRKCLETNNFSYLSGLIEETQVLVNRMESALYDKKDVRYLPEKLRELKEEKRKLKEEIEKLKEKKEKIKEFIVLMNKPKKKAKKG